MKIKKTLLLTLAGLTISTAVATAFAQYLIERNASTRIYRDVRDLPKNPVCLVLGCSPNLSNGTRNPFFEKRLLAAAEIWTAHQCQKFLLSGDNHSKKYDEPTAMKIRLIELGVPESAIVLDFAGFSTFDSIVRAKEVFNTDKITIVSQSDHAKRAIYLADHLGVTAVAFEAQDVGFRYGMRTKLREALARVRAVLDVTLFNRKPHFLGPTIEISKA